MIVRLRPLATAPKEIAQVPSERVPVLAAWGEMAKVPCEGNSDADSESMLGASMASISSQPTANPRLPEKYSVV